MSDARRWSFVVGVAMAVVFGTALAVKIRPQIDLLGVGSRAPGFHAKNLATGRAATLADYRGRVVLLNLWATWCEPCRVEMPSLERLSRKLGGSGFTVVAVSIDEDGDSVVAAFARGPRLTFDMLHDQSGAMQQTYHAPRVPAGGMLSPQVGLIQEVIGASEWDGPVNETLVRRLLAER